MLTVTDHQNNVTTITYDTLGRKKTMAEPDMKTWQYPEYDKNNNLKRQIDANGVTTSFEYDEQNRMTKKSYSTSQSPVVYAYDETTVTNGIGVLTTLSNGSTVIKNNGFDVVGRLKSQTKTIAGTGYTTQYTYDLSGKTKTITYPDNYAVSYEYHPGSGLLYQVMGVTDLQIYGRYANYDVTGKIGTLKFGNDTTTEYTYDPQSKMLKSYHNWYDNVDPSKDIELQNREYAYTRAGDIKDVTDILKNTKHSYTYDNLHRLRTETNSVNSDRVEYTYNPIGGIQTKTTVQGGVTDSFVYAYEGTHAHGVSKITRNGTAYTFGYDTNGAMTTGFDFSRPGTAATRSITYNADRMPVTINRGGVVTTLEYDGAGTRSRKIAGANTTVYVGDHYEVKNGVAVKYIFGGNLRIAKITANVVTYFHKDHLGSSVLMTDAAGKPVSNTATSYEPFGEDRVYSALDAKDYKYTDQEYDSEAGLYNYNARMYDPGIGVFVSEDIFVQDFANPQVLNRYAYCLNNPMIYVDPSGYWSFRKAWGRIRREFRRSVDKINAEIDRFSDRNNIRINGGIGAGTDGENWDIVGPDGSPAGGSYGPDEEYDERSNVYEWYQANYSGSYGSGPAIEAYVWNTDRFTPSSIDFDPLFDLAPLSASYLVYSKNNNMLRMYSAGGKPLGIYPASNISLNEKGPWPYGKYSFAYIVPHPESDINGQYGSYGNIVFSVPGWSGVGIHSGRFNRKGWVNPTMGCIRTTDASMMRITNIHRNDPITSLTVEMNGTF